MRLINFFIIFRQSISSFRNFTSHLKLLLDLWNNYLTLISPLRSGSWFITKILISIHVNIILSTLLASNTCATAFALFLVCFILDWSRSMLFKCANFLVCHAPDSARNMFFNNQLLLTSSIIFLHIFRYFQEIYTTLCENFAIYFINFKRFSAQFFH